MPIYSIMVCAINYIMRTEMLILQQFVKLSLEVTLCYSTHVLANEFAALEEEQCRDIAYAILCSNVVVLLNVALAYNNLAVVFVGEL